MQPSAVAASHLIRHNLRDFIRRSFAGGKTAWAPEQAPIRWPTCFSCRFVEDDDDDDKEENYLQKTLLQRGGQSQLGVDMATPSLSVLVMSSEILHALDGGRTVEGERDRGEETQAGGGWRRAAWQADDRLARCRVPKVRMRHLVASGTS